MRETYTKIQMVIDEQTEPECSERNTELETTLQRQRHGQRNLGSDVGLFMTSWKGRDVQTCQQRAAEPPRAAELSSYHWTCTKHGQPPREI